MGDFTRITKINVGGHEKFVQALPKHMEFSLKKLGRHLSHKLSMGNIMYDSQGHLVLNQLKVMFDKYLPYPFVYMNWRIFRLDIEFSNLSRNDISHWIELHKHNPPELFCVGEEYSSAPRWHEPYDEEYVINLQTLMGRENYLTFLEEYKLLTGYDYETKEDYIQYIKDNESEQERECPIIV